jgi:hypothetical protein
MFEILIGYVSDIGSIMFEILIGYVSEIGSIMFERLIGYVSDIYYGLVFQLHISQNISVFLRLFLLYATSSHASPVHSYGGYAPLPSFQFYSSVLIILTYYRLAVVSVSRNRSHNHLWLIL